MGLRVRFVAPRRFHDSPFVHGGPKIQWKRFYQPPWLTLYHIVEVFSLLLIYGFLSTKTIYYYYMHRQVFVDAFYPDYEDEDTPISTITEITDYFDDVVESLNDILTDSFMNITLSNSYSILYKIQWRNGSSSVWEDEYGEIDQDFFTHISSLTLSLDFLTLSDEKSTKGCSRWLVQSQIYAKEGQSVFSIVPSIKRQHCPAEVIIRHDLKDKVSVGASPERKAIGSSLRFEKSRPLPGWRHLNKVKQNTLKKRSFKHEKKVRSEKPRAKLLEFPRWTVKPTFRRPEIPIWRMSFEFSVRLTMIACLHLVFLSLRIRKDFLVHMTWMKTSPDYRHLPTLQQYHFSIGYWKTIDLISTVMVIAASSFMLHDCYSMTQFPSQAVIEVLGVATMLSVIRFSQWFGSYLPFYQLIVIIREACIRLMALIISILPIVTGFCLWGIFTFGFIDDSFETFRYLVQRMITSGMGDSIDDFYIIIDDGTELTSWLCFFYVSMITAAGMWIVFTSCIATVSYIHQTHIVKRDSYWESSSDTGTAESY